MINIKKTYVILGISVITLLSMFSIYNNFKSVNNLRQASNISNSNDKVIYLTFDDGPSPKITDKILDILKEKNVKATFFIIGDKIKYKQETVRRIHNEGHAIGLHTYTHNYKKIYSSDKAFITEMDETSDEVYNLLGIRPTAIRFPTGSVKHLNKRLYKELKEKKYKIFDWNARITDGVNPNKAPSEFYEEAVKSSKKWSNVFMLMHCDALNSNTCKALPRIIDYFKNNNYTFKIIDDNTPEYFFKSKIKN